MDYSRIPCSDEFISAIELKLMPLSKKNQKKDQVVKEEVVAKNELRKMTKIMNESTRFKLANKNSLKKADTHSLTNSLKKNTSYQSNNKLTAKKKSADSISNGNQRKLKKIDSNMKVSKDKGVVLKQGVEIRIGNETISIKKGAENGRGLDSLAAYSFNEDYYYGKYQTEAGRDVEILDDRKNSGRLILVDYSTGLKRKLKNAGMGEFIYTYGPTYNDDYPVEGTIVFLPGSGHWIQRFMWMPEKGASIYPDKID